MIDLNIYSRISLSDWLQISQQLDNTGNPLPCWLVEQVAEAHDRLLRQQFKIGKIINKFCKNHQSCNLYQAECGRIFCPDCLDSEAAE